MTSDLDALVVRLEMEWFFPDPSASAKKVEAVLAQRKEAAAAITALREENERLREALEPFALRSFDEPIFDDEGWTELGMSWSRDRIVDWFGPSDFRRACSALG